MSAGSDSQESWVLLVDADGKPLMGNTAELVNAAIVAHLRTEVKLVHSSTLAHVKASQLQVFRDEVALKEDRPLESDMLVKELGKFGKSSKDPLLVVVIQICYKLVNNQGTAYRNTSLDRIVMASAANIADLREAVKFKNTNTLATVDTSVLKVFENEVDFRADTPLDFDIPIKGKGKTKDTALFIMVPEQSNLDLGPPTKKAKIDWMTTTQVKAQHYNPKESFFTLDTSYLLNSGLPQDGPLILYCRQAFRDQFKFLKKCVIKKKRLGWILGPPGTGKSTTTLAFASTLKRERWDFTWLHLGRLRQNTYCKYQGEIKKSCTVDLGRDELKDVLSDYEIGRRHIMFVDGFVAGQHNEYGKMCNAWLWRDKKYRRLVYVCSMSARGKVSSDEDMVDKVKEFFVYSWKLHEYKLAIRDDAFFEKNKIYLDSSHDADDEQGSLEETNLDSNAKLALREEMIESKFYFAGGCSRYMFSRQTNTVISELMVSIGAVHDIVPYIENTTGERSDLVINRLFSIYKKGEAFKPLEKLKIDEELEADEESEADEEFEADEGLAREAHDVSIVSAWAASEFAIKCGPDGVKRVAEVTDEAGNPAMDGWMFEMWFFALLKKQGVLLHGIKDDESETWPCSGLTPLGSIDIPVLPDEHGVWLKPRKWNEAGYDAIFVDKQNRFVRFVQVTRADKHPFKIQHFWKFMQRLKAVSIKIDRVDIVFLVDHEKIENFQIKPVLGQGLLHDYGWEKNTEVKMVKKLGIKGWKDSLKRK